MPLFGKTKGASGGGGKSKGEKPKRKKSGSKSKRSSSLSLADLTIVGGRPTSVYQESDEDNVTWEKTVSKKMLKSLDERERKRQRVIFELIQTEHSYLRDLVVMKNLFRQRVLDADCITADQVFGLFCNLDEIIAVNGELYERLVVLKQDGVVENVADIFLEMFHPTSGRFEAYEQFCANQLPAGELYSVLEAKNPEFAKVMAECKAQTQESRGFDLPAFILKPMQRLLKYHPLLQQILKRTKEDSHVQIAQLIDAMQLVEEHGRRVNERVRASENARRLLKIRDLLVKEAGTKWVGKSQLSDITADPERSLMFEGKLGFVRPQTAGGGAGAKAQDVYVILLSDMLLVTTERDGKFVLKGSKDPFPATLVDMITDVRAEVTRDSPSRARTTLCIEIGEPTQVKAATKGMDSPRPVMKNSRKHYMRFLASTQGVLRNWIIFLHEARQNRRDRFSRLERQAAAGSLGAGEEYAITFLVTTEVKFAQESSTDREMSEDETIRMSDWELTFAGEEGGEASVETTRHVRLVKGPDGLGFTVIGRAPVEFQEIEEDGPAWRAGLRVGDQIRAVNGVECTNLSHDEVVALIQQALSVPQVRTWAPVLAPLEAVAEEDAESMLSSTSRGARSLRVGMLEERSDERVFFENSS